MTRTYKDWKYERYMHRDRRRTQLFDEKPPADSTVTAPAHQQSRSRSDLCAGHAGNAIGGGQDVRCASGWSAVTRAQASWDQIEITGPDSDRASAVEFAPRPGAMSKKVSVRGGTCTLTTCLDLAAA
jgi:hypothetical protein